MMFFLKYLLIFLIGSSVVLADYTSVQSARDFNLISLEQEWKLGNRLSRGISRKANLVTDRSSEAYINQLGQRLVQQTEFRNLPWQFHIIQGKEINAFNIPGGHVYVYTGLIQETSTESELAGVIAHEIAHGVERHSTEALTRQYGLRVIGSVVLGKNPSAYERILAQIIGAGYLAKHSRDDEREADQLGIHYMYQAGFDPNGLVTFFQKLLEEEDRQPGRLERFFSSHPLTQERIRNANREISKLPPKPGLISDSPQFHAFKNNLFGSSKRYRGQGRVPQRNR